MFSATNIVKRSDNCNKNILELNEYEGDTFGKTGSIDATEKKIIFNFSREKTKFCLRFHYNHDNNYLFLTGKKSISLKQHDENLNNSMGLDKYDVFAQGLKSPGCVKVLLNCFQNLEKEVINVKEISLAAKEWKIKTNEQLKQMNLAITFINEKFVEFEKEKK